MWTLHRRLIVSATGQARRHDSATKADSEPEAAWPRGAEDGVTLAVLTNAPTELEEPLLFQVTVLLSCANHRFFKRKSSPCRVGITVRSVAKCALRPWS